jgi:glycosyltransferase involved in cell wall biosynthesis
MKIALTLYPINDMGGIINHTEQLAYALQELGHKINLHILCWQSRFAKTDISLPVDPSWSTGAFGLPVHQCYGWKARPWIEKLAYKNENDFDKTLDILSKYDLIIWEVPIPTKLKAHIGNDKWTKLYSACDKNVLVIHDGNVLATPWIYEIADKVTAMACVHERSYKTSKSIPIPHALILNPQDLTRISKKPYNNRAKGFLSLQIFKALKHTEDIIRAIPYMPTLFIKMIAGGGIEQRYMVSKTKVKPKYVCSKKYDPDLKDKYVGKPIWNVALKYGMDYLGFISEKERDVILRNLRTLIDPTWDTKPAKLGGYFNRVIMEAMKQGAIPIAINRGISVDDSGESFLLHPNKNYIMLDYRLTPKQYAEAIVDANNLSNNIASRIMEKNFKLLNNFERKHIAEQFIKLSKLEPCGYFDKIIEGNFVKELKLKSRKEMKEFFRKG